MSAQSCPTLCDPVGSGLPGSSTRQIFRQGHWSELPFPTPGDILNPGIQPASLGSPSVAGRFFTTSVPWEALM